ncbi:hypothetical protein TWF730_002945 [Orbilia blumenaviensis]|uniref:Uncharacterized protein n=1 Tax=Orbilia blumenaviensis TaxID=1796055 RepID=A0AAV9UBX6_9PEZI
MPVPKSAPKKTFKKFFMFFFFLLPNIISDNLVFWGGAGRVVTLGVACFFPLWTGKTCEVKEDFVGCESGYFGEIAFANKMPFTKGPSILATEGFYAVLYYVIYFSLKRSSEIVKPLHAIELCTEFGLLGALFIRSFD